MEDHMQNTFETNPIPSSNNRSLDVLVRVVINSLPSPRSKRVYSMAIRHFVEYIESQEDPILDKLFLQTYISAMQDEGIGDASINLRLAAIRKFSREAEELKIWPETVTAAFVSVKKIPQRGKRIGNWLTLEQAQQLINAPDTATPMGLRNRAILVTLLGCGIHRNELVNLSPAQLQMREGRWVIADLVGKRNKTRTVTVPLWVKQSIDAYLAYTQICSGRLFQAMSKRGRILRDHISSETVREVVLRYGHKCGFSITPHDLRRTYAKLALKNGAKINQIQLNLGHESLATTQVYLGNDLDLKNGPGDFLPIHII
jgi:site-specific recombinase XerD